MSAGNLYMTVWTFEFLAVRPVSEVNVDAAT